MSTNEMITQLPTVATSALTDIIYAVQGYVSPSSPGTSVQETLQQVFNLMLSNTVLHHAGNPNGAVAGNVYQLCWDTTNSIMYVCTTSGTSSSAVWTDISPGSSLITPALGGTGVSDPTAHTLPVAEGASNFNFLGPLTNGQLLIGSAGADPVPTTLTAGPGISIANGAGSITISGTASGIGWTDVTGASQAMAADSGYTANNAGLVTFTLPSTAAYGTGLAVVGKGAGGWKINVGTGQNIQVGSLSTTVTTGSVASTNQFDAINLVCTTVNTTWTVLGGVQGNLTIV
jgi:hypothetical protein